MLRGWQNLQEIRFLGLRTRCHPRKKGLKMQRFKMTLRVDGDAFLTQEARYPNDASRIEIALSLMSLEQKLIDRHVHVGLEELEACECEVGCCCCKEE